jgi:hypothetical protein
MVHAFPRVASVMHCEQNVRFFSTMAPPLPPPLLPDEDDDNVNCVDGANSTSTLDTEQRVHTTPSQHRQLRRLVPRKPNDLEHTLQRPGAEPDGPDTDPCDPSF